ncbi:MAG: cytochrome C, partial [Dehalococcoidia bacterium]|nr:cytochrome C [Dehalococcoidia bacterium]
ALVTHRSSIILAVGFVTIVHFYYGHMAPKAFPLNTVIFTGKMPADKYKEWYYLDYLNRTKKSDNRETKE